MSKQLIAVSDDEYIFSETEKENAFCLFRVDGEKFGEGEVDENMISAFLDVYSSNKYVTDVDFEGDVYFELKDDGRCYLVVHEATSKKKPSFLKRFFHKIKTALK